MTQPWAIRVSMLQDELFSTWLVRAALAQGCDPMDLTGSLWPRWRPWTLDIDRGLRGDRLAILASRSGVEARRLEESTLRPLIAAVAPDARPEHAVWPWVLTQGSRNRRRYGGMQFCASCLAEDATPYFRRSWRLAWHVGCLRHRTLLADHCGQCRSPIEPHLLRATDLTLCKCATCRSDLRRTTTAPACVQALEFQAAADQVLAEGSGAWSGTVVTCEAWFRMARASASGKISRMADDEPPPGVTSLAMNLQRPSERVLRLRMALRSMHAQALGQPVLSQLTGTATPKSKAAAASRRGAIRQPAPARPQLRVQGEWVRLLRKLRVGHP